MILEEKMIISERIFCVMEQKNITQLELSRRTGIATSNISDWKKKKTNPKADCLLSICDALEITPEQLLTGKGIDPEYKDEDANYEVTRSDIKILKQIHSLGDEQYKRLMAYMKALQKLEQMTNKIVREIIHAKGIDIGIYTKDFENEYISLTDIAKYRNDNDPRFVIQNWMRNRNTVEFLAVWEELHNPDFNRVQFEAVRSEAGLNRFVMTPTKWIEQTNAIGIVSKAGRYGGGTYAHSDIAMAFATWISPEFQLYIMKDYRRLKQDENSRFSLDWNLNRALSKVNYHIHTDAVKENLIPPELTPEQIAYTYASEADLLNVALFGQTAKQWKNNNPSKKGNVRDDANLNQLLVLANMESYNAILIEQGKSQSERLVLLRNLAIKQMDTLASINLSAVSALPGGDM